MKEPHIKKRARNIIILVVLVFSTSLLPKFKPDYYKNPVEMFWIMISIGTLLVLLLLYYLFMPFNKQKIDKKVKEILEENKLIKISNKKFIIIILLLTIVFSTTEYLKDGQTSFTWEVVLIILLLVFIQYSKGIYNAYKIDKAKRLKKKK